MQTPDVYEGIRIQIEKGHLPLSFILGDVHLKFRNPSIEDFDLVAEISPTQGWKQDVALLSSCLLTINGRDATGDINALIDAFSCVSKSLKRVLFSNLIRLTDKARKSYVYLEAYCYEEESRALWRSWKANRFMGFNPVLHQTHLSPLQVSWVTWNTAEDERLQSRDEWDRTLFSASAFNGSVQKIRNKWDSSDKEEEENRENVKKAAREGNLDKAKEGVKGQRQKTVKDLQDEMRRWVSGEEDLHDQIVREYKETIRLKVKEQAERAVKMREEKIRREQDVREHSIVARPVHAVSADDLRAILAGKEDNTSIATDELSEYRRDVVERFVLTDEDKGNISLSRDGKSLVQKSESIMDKVSQRKPTI